MNTEAMREVLSLPRNRWQTLERRHSHSVNHIDWNKPIINGVRFMRITGCRIRTGSTRTNMVNLYAFCDGISPPPWPEVEQSGVVVLEAGSRLARISTSAGPQQAVWSAPWGEDDNNYIKIDASSARKMRDLNRVRAELIRLDVSTDAIDEQFREVRSSLFDEVLNQIDRSE